MSLRYQNQATLQQQSAGDAFPGEPETGIRVGVGQRVDAEADAGAVPRTAAVSVPTVGRTVDVRLGQVVVDVPRSEFHPVDLVHRTRPSRTARSAPASQLIAARFVTDCERFELFPVALVVCLCLDVNSELVTAGRRELMETFQANPIV